VLRKAKKSRVKKYTVEVRVPQGHMINVRAKTTSEAKRKAKKKLSSRGWWVVRDR